MLAWPLPWPGPIPLLTASAVLDARHGRCRGRGCEDALFAEVAARDCKIVSALFCTDGITSCCFPQHNDTGGTRSLGNLHCVHGRGYFPVAFKLPSSARSWPCSSKIKLIPPKAWVGLSLKRSACGCVLRGGPPLPAPAAASLLAAAGPDTDNRRS